MRRRSFVRSLIAAPALSAAALVDPDAPGRPVRDPSDSPFLRVSCNLYSFNGPLSRGEMSLEEVFDFCAELGFDAVDPTGYYFPGYPQLPPDEYVFALKRRAFLMGLEISGTGVRNDFTVEDPERRASDVRLVEDWVGLAARLGAPCLRVFAGGAMPAGHSREEMEGWVAEGVRACAELGKARGVMISLQNHADFLRTADGVMQMLRRVDSEWVGVNLDIDGFRTRDPYEDIARIAPQAITWQIKERVTVNGAQEKVDLDRLVQIIRDARYRGYLPIETLGEGDPKEKVTRLFGELKEALA